MSSPFQQELDDVDVACSRRSGQRRIPLAIALVEIRPFIHEKLHDLQMAVPGRREQRRALFVVDYTDIRPLLQQRLHHVEIALPSGHHERLGAHISSLWGEDHFRPPRIGRSTVMSHS